MTAIQKAIDIIEETNASPEERSDCAICLDGFGCKKESPGEIPVNAAENAVTCFVCKSMYHGPCFAEHWWRINVRKAMLSFRDSNSHTRDFYFEIGGNHQKLMQLKTTRRLELKKAEKNVLWRERVLLKFKGALKEMSDFKSMVFSDFFVLIEFLLQLHFK